MSRKLSYAIVASKDVDAIKADEKLLNQLNYETLSIRNNNWYSQQFNNVCYWTYGNLLAICVVMSESLTIHLKNLEANSQTPSHNETYTDLVEMQSIYRELMLAHEKVVLNRLGPFTLIVRPSS